MVLRKGKEPASAPDDIEAPETVQDTRWLNGVNRQLRPDAPSQRAPRYQMWNVVAPSPSVNSYYVSCKVYRLLGWW